MKTLLFLINFLLFKAILATPQKDVFLKAQDHFEKDRCREAIKLLKSIDPKIDLENTEIMINIYKIKAICYFELKDLINSKNAIKEIYLIDPNFTFDAFSTPKEVVDLANIEKKMIEEKSLKLTNEKLDFLREENNNSINLIKEKKILPMGTSLFPLGINHYLLEHKIKGPIYLLSQSFFLAANISSFFVKQSYFKGFGIYELEDLKNEKKFIRAQNIQFISLGAFLMIYTISVIDAFVNFDKNNN